MNLPKSIKIGYATFFDHIHTPELFRARVHQLFRWIEDGSLKVNIGGTYALANARMLMQTWKAAPPPASCC